MGKLILIRHGETNKNLDKKLHSSGDEESLNATGRKQIYKTAKKLTEFKPDIIYSSKEKRAIESAEVISELLSLPVHLIEGLKERNWGVFTGKSWEEVKKVLDKMTLEERYNYVPESGESWKEFETRLVQSIKQVTENNKNVVVVTHGGAIRALMPLLLNLPKEESFNYNPDNASITVFVFDEKSRLYKQLML